MLTLNNINGQYVKFYFTTNTLLPQLLKNTAAIIILQEYAGQTTTSYFKINEDTENTINFYNDINNLDPNYSFIDNYDMAYMDKELERKKYLFSEIDKYRLYYSVWIGGKKILSGYGFHQSTLDFLNKFFYEFLKLKNTVDYVETYYVSHKPWIKKGTDNEISTKHDLIIDPETLENNVKYSENEEYNISYTYFIPKSYLTIDNPNSQFKKLYMVDFTQNVIDIIGYAISKQTTGCSNAQYLIYYKDNDISSQINTLSRGVLTDINRIVIDELNEYSLLKKINIKFTLIIPTHELDLYCKVINQQRYVSYALEVVYNNVVIAKVDPLQAVEPLQEKEFNFVLNIEHTLTMSQSSNITDGSTYVVKLLLYKVNEDNEFITEMIPGENPHTIYLPELYFRIGNMHDIYIQAQPKDQIRYNYSYPLQQFNKSLSYFYCSNVNNQLFRNVSLGNKNVIYFMVKNSLKINNLYLSWYINGESNTTSEFVNITNYCKLYPQILINYTKNNLTEYYNVYAVDLLVSTYSTQFDDKCVTVNLPSGNKFIFTFRIDVEPEILLEQYKASEGITSTVFTIQNEDINIVPVLEDPSLRDKVIYINNSIYDTTDWYNVINLGPSQLSENNGNINIYDNSFSKND